MKVWILIQREGEADDFTSRGAVLDVFASEAAAIAERETYRKAAEAEFSDDDGIYYDIEEFVVRATKNSA